MKIRHPQLIKLASWCGTQIIRTLCGSMTYQARCIGENWLPDTPSLPRRVIYAFWHETMLIPAYRYGRPDVHALVSSHTDGQFLAGMLQQLGFSTVAGSSGRSGTEAMRRMLKIGQESHIAISPDGPRGPRRKLKSGPIYLAARTGMPIVPFGFACNRAMRAKSWDRLIVPKLFSKGYGVCASPICIPRGIEREELEPYRQYVEEVLHAVSEIAERWAATGLYDTYDYDSLSHDLLRETAMTALPR
jgi:hypothetical protein